MSAEPACVGQHNLFDATDIQTHREAAAICATCPAIEACRVLLRDVLADAKTVGVEGTWAGMGFGIRTNSPVQIAAESARYTTDDARKAHALYRNGMRDEWINTGERVYQRRANRAPKRKAS